MTIMMAEDKAQFRCHRLNHHRFILVKSIDIAGLFAATGLAGSGHAQAAEGLAGWGRAG